MRDIALSFIVLAMIGLGLTSASLGIMLWIWTALGIPNSYMFGFLTAIPLNKVTAAIAVLAILCDRRRGRFYVDGLIMLLILMLAQALVSYNLRITMLARPDDVMDRFYKVLLLCYCMAFVRRDRLDLHSLLLIIAISGGIHGILEGMKYIASLGSHRMQPPASLGDNNYVAMYCLMICPLFAYLAKYTEHRHLRLAWIGCLLLLVVGVVASGSRGGFLGLLVFGALLLAQSRRKLPVLACILAGAAILLVATPASWRDRMDTISTAAEDDNSFLSRVKSWEMNAVIALDRPLIGGGFSATEDPYVFQQYRPSFERANIASLDPPEHPLAAHSIYFQVLGDMGFPGLFLLLGILLKTYRNLSWTIRRTRGNNDLLWACDMARAFRVALVIYCVCGAALSAPYAELAYIMFMTVSLLRRYVAEQLPERAAFAVPAGVRDRA